MTDPNSPEVQAIFAQLHALGVTPEQAAAGVARLSPQWRFRVGDKCCHEGDAATVGNTDYDGADGLEVLIRYLDGDIAWVPHTALDRVEPTT